MKKYYKVTAGYECGGAEDGMMCKCGTFIIEAIDKSEAKKICDSRNADDRDYLGCRVDDATEEEIKEWKEWLAMEWPF